MITSKLPSPTGIQSMLNRWFRKLRLQPRIIELVPIVFPSAGSVVYLVSNAVGTMSLRRINSADVRLLSIRFYVLAIIVSFALTSGSLEVSSTQESHNLRNFNSLKDKSIEGNLLVSSHGRFLGQENLSLSINIIFDDVRVPASFYLPNLVYMVQLLNHHSGNVLAFHTHNRTSRWHIHHIPAKDQDPRSPSCKRNSKRFPSIQGSKIQDVIRNEALSAMTTL
ncbi:hypothetical protein Tco_1285915 [Tanacetum coccineum]